jgi:hypothetical protein
MLTFILVLAFLTIVLCPILSALYAEAKLQTSDHKKMLFCLGFIPGICLFVLYAVLKPNDPPVTASQACGVVQFYKVHKTRAGQFERVSIRFEDSKYNRHLLFKDGLDRPKQGEYVCFDYLDKLKYSHLSESKLLSWAE